MKKYLSLALALAMMVSTAALAACGDNSETTTGSTSGSTAAVTTGDSTTTAAATGDITPGTEAETEGDNDPTTPATTEGEDDPDTTPGYSVPDDPFSAQFHGYDPIENMEAYKAEHKNLMESFVGLVVSQSIFSGNDWTNSEEEQFSGLGNEDAPNLFDGDPNTKWCCGRELVEFAAALVWEMSESVNVTAYSLTTGNDNTEWTSRNPVQWRLYGTNTLPETVMTDENPEEVDTYLASGTVPEGWILIDAVDASDPYDPMSSQMPDEDHKEVGFEVEHPGSYKYFLFLIDWTEVDDITFQLSEFTLYGD